MPNEKPVSEIHIQCFETFSATLTLIIVESTLVAI